MRSKFGPYQKIYNINHANESFANWYYENELLGYTHGTPLRSIFLNKNPELLPIDQVKSAATRSKVYFVGTISDCTGVRTSKNGNEYVKFEVGDEFDSIDVLLFNNKRGNGIDDCIEYNKGSLPDKKNIVIVTGTKSEDGVFANYVTVQDSKIYMKLGQLRNDEKNL